MSDMNDVIIASIVALPPTLVALAGLIVTKNNSKDIKEVHLSVNSRMDELLKTSKSSSRAQGQREGRKEKVIKIK